MKQQFRLQLVLSFFLTIIVAGLVVGCVWFIREMMSKKNTLLNAQQHMISYQENKKIFEAESDAFSEITRKIKLFEKNIITPASTPTLLSSFETLARSQGVNFSITSVQTPGKQKTQLLIEFSASGGRDALEKFLTTLEHQSYQIKYTRFSFSYDSVGNIWNMVGALQIMSY